jgi:hypothetical protein
MKNVLPTLIPLIVMIAGALTAPVQVFITHHPLLSLVFASVGQIINHWIPSPAQLTK